MITVYKKSIRKIDMCIRTIEELQEDTREKQIIDIRDAADFEKETYPGAVNIYWEELAAHMDEIRKDCPVYLLCYTGQKSEEIAEELTEQGYEIYSIKNGYRAWLKMKLITMQRNSVQRTLNEALSRNSANLSGDGLRRQSENMNWCRMVIKLQSAFLVEKIPC